MKKPIHRAAQDNRSHRGAAGIETISSTHIRLKYEMYGQREETLKDLSDFIKMIRIAKDREEVIACAWLATGCANTIKRMDLISERELNEIIEIISKEGARAIHRIETAHCPKWKKFIKRVIGI